MGRSFAIGSLFGGALPEEQPVRLQPVFAKVRK